MEGEKKRFVGKTEYSLSETGRRQICQAGEEYRGRPEHIWSSPSIRCQESARIFYEILAERIEEPCRPRIILREDLREINLGEWDGKTFTRIREEFPGAFAERGRNLAGYRTPKGETFEEVQDRAVKAVKDIGANTDSEAVLFTHLGVLRTLRCYFEKRPLSEMMEWKADYGECLILEGIDQNHIHILR